MKTPLLIARVAAADLCDYWNAVDINDDGEFARDNADYIDAIREAFIELERAMAKQKKALLLVELEDNVRKEVFDQADNCLDIVYSLIDDANDEAEPNLTSLRRLRALKRAYQRLLKKK
jgi:hypothetical protein